MTLFLLVAWNVVLLRKILNVNLLVAIRLCMISIDVEMFHQILDEAQAGDQLRSLVRGVRRGMVMANQVQSKQMIILRHKYVF